MNQRSPGDAGGFVSRAGVLSWPEGAACAEVGAEPGCSGWRDRSRFGLSCSHLVNQLNLRPLERVLLDRKGLHPYTGPAVFKKQKTAYSFCARLRVQMVYKLKGPTDKLFKA